MRNALNKKEYYSLICVIKQNENWNCEKCSLRTSLLPTALLC